MCRLVKRLRCDLVLWLVTQKESSPAGPSCPESCPSTLNRMTCSMLCLEDSLVSMPVRSRKWFLFCEWVAFKTIVKSTMTAWSYWVLSFSVAVGAAVHSDVHFVMEEMAENACFTRQHLCRDKPAFEKSNGFNFCFLLPCSSSFFCNRKLTGNNNVCRITTDCNCLERNKALVVKNFSQFTLWQGQVNGLMWQANCGRW